MLDYLSRALQRSQYDAEFGAYGNMMLWFALIVFVVHVAKQAAIAWQAPVAVVISVQMSQFVFMGVVLWRARPQGVLPTSMAERQMYAVWVGYLLGCGLVSVVTRLRYEVEELYASADYPYFSILAGMAFFVLGSSYWEQCFLFGLAFFALAVLLPLPQVLPWGPLAFGTLWALILVRVGLRLRGVAREAEARR